MRGMKNSAKRRMGIIKPTAVPYCQPQIKAHRNTGRCMGSNMLPISLICPVKKGSTKPMARNIAASSRFLSD